MKKIVVLLACFLILITPTSALTIAPLDVRYNDINDLTRAMDAGIINSEQLVNIYLERINEYNDDFKAITFINENAISEAKKLDNERSEGKIKGILHGIPIIVKTNIDVKGLATTAGAKALANNMPNSDAEVVNRLKNAGAIILATTNMSEFAFSARDSVSSYGTVKNAYNPLYTSYGSSGGSAVGVALSFAAAALGTDTNSSIRVPSSAAYLVGFRPTFDLLSTKGIIPYDTTRDVVGPITKTARDSAIMMSILSGNDYLNSIKKDGLKGKKIGVATELYIGSNNANVIHNQKTYQPIIDLMSEKLEKMKELGATIIDIDKLYTSHYYQIARDTLGGYTMCDGFNEYIKGSSGEVKSFRDLQNKPGKVYSLAGYENGCNQTSFINNNIKSRRSEYADYINDIFAEYDVDAIVYPTTKNKLFILRDEGNPLNSPGTNITSVIGFTSVSVPLGFDEDGLPYGMEFLGKPNTEDVLLEIISGYETINPEIIVTSLAPSLFDINPEVTLLIENYYDLLDRNKTNKNIDNLILETKEYFVSYEQNENRDTQAQILNEKYTKIDEVNIVGKILDTNFIKIFIIIITILIILRLRVKYIQFRKKNKNFA